jgi:DNA polymerase III subunit alpha
MFVIPLHVHSHWSLLDGIPSVQEIVDLAESRHLPAIALTDTNALYGAMEFIVGCRKADIAPIIGAELTLTGGHSIVLLAQNLQGYSGLCQLITRLQAAPDREASLARGLSLADLAQHTEGLIALSGGRCGPLDAGLRDPRLRDPRLHSDGTVQAESVAQEFVNLFGQDRFFIELQIIEEGDAEKAAALQSLADRLHLRTVATHDIHYLTPADAPHYQVLTAMRQGRRVKDLPPLVDLSYPPEDEMQHRFADFFPALDHTEWIANQCHFEFPLGQLHFPTLDLPPGRTTHEELWTRALAGASQRYSGLTPAVEARLRKEVDVIDTLGYTPYFLVVADIVRYAREKHVPISPRGSASSSVVAYCLGIHDIDPIAHNLYFERFLSLERHDPPDIDLDLCSHRRDEVIEYVYQKYGADHVAMVCTYATLRARYALREVGKAYGLPETRIKELSAQLPGFWHALRGARKRMQDAQAELIEQARDPVERQVLETSRVLDGTPHHLSIHPGGIVISPGPITDLVPLQYATKGLLVTQFDMGGIEKLGLVKIDLLGISALTVIADCVELVRQRQPDFTLESIPQQDAAAAQTLATARTIGCFQTESPGMRMTLRELSTRTVNDLIVALALYRPGPLKGGLKDAFVRRHLGQEPAEYLHPALEPILRETCGVILYQEQVLRIAHEVAGFSLGDADILRRAMSKFRSAHEMERLHAQFVAGAQATSGLDATLAQQVWELMAAFAGYGFPKAHAAGYAVVAYRMAYLKTRYPAEFMAARLAVSGGFYRPSVYMSEARQLGLAAKPPHVNHSDEAFALEPPQTLWMGLGQVRELTHTTLKTILAQRPFESLADFLARAQPQYVEAVNLVKVGALDGLGNAKAMLSQLERDRWHGRHAGQMGLLVTQPTIATPDPTLHERAAWERELLGMLVSVHPLQLVAKEINHSLIRSDELSRHTGQDVTLAGVRLAAHRFSAQQAPMLLVDMEDEAGIYQVLWSGAALDHYRSALSQREPVLIRGRVRTDRQGQTVMAGHEITRLE